MSASLGDLTFVLGTVLALAVVVVIDAAIARRRGRK